MTCEPRRAGERVGPLAVTVRGTPVPAGSKIPRIIPRVPGTRTGPPTAFRAILVDSSDMGGPNRKGGRRRDWSDAIEQAARVAATGLPQFEGPLQVRMVFVMPRPKSHRCKSGVPRESAPIYPISKPDVDKLWRLASDALTHAGVWADDSRVVDMKASKRYDDREPAGVMITVEEIVQEDEP